MKRRTPCFIASIFVLLFAVGFAGAIGIPPIHNEDPQTQHTPMPAVPHYVSLEVDGGTAVYLKFYKDQLFVASSLRGLQTAKPIDHVKLVPNDQIQFPEINLPIKKDALPLYLDRLRARFVFTGEIEDGIGRLEGHINYVATTLTPDKKEYWGYLVQFYGHTSTSAPMKVVRIPQLINVKPEIIGIQMVNNSRIGLALLPHEVLSQFDQAPPLASNGRAEYAATGLIDIQKNGRSVPVWVKVFGLDSRLISAKQGTLQDFGYS